MNPDDDRDKVSQSKNEVNHGDIIGGNKQITTHNNHFYFIDFISTQGLIDKLKSNSNLDENHLHEIIRNLENENIKSLNQQLGLWEAVQSSQVNLLNEEIQNEYAKIISSPIMHSKDVEINENIKIAGSYFRKLAFEKAHKTFSDTLELITPIDKRYKLIYREYLITGLIYYSKKNDIEGLSSLMQKGQDTSSKEASNIEYIISLIYQEIFTRSIDLIELENIVKKLDQTFRSASDDMKPAMANSLGLAYRRLGERTSLVFLEQAVDIFQQGLDINKNKEDKIMDIELKDQMAIAHVRIFEFNNQEKHLFIAETLLNDCLRALEEPMTPIGYRLKPRILNNMGNVYKQRTLILKEISGASKAIAYYEEAEQYWSKGNADYEWALLRKNIAETKYALGCIIKKKALILGALDDTMLSIRYRDFSNSPYQWGKTLKIAFEIIILLDDLKANKDIPKNTRDEILSAINTVLSEDKKWSENISKEFVDNAKLTQTLLS